MEQSDSASYWTRLAASYELLGSPLRPAAEEIALMEDAMAEWASRRGAGAMRGLLLGVTPGLVAMRWPAGCSLLAVERVPAMISALWPRGAGERWAVCADWRELPVRAGSCDIVTGDGSLNCVRYPGGICEAARALRQALADDGMAVLRFYTKPEVAEDADQVFDELLRGLIPTFGEFKFRLLVAMQRVTRLGVCVGDVYEEWRSRGIEVDRLGWDTRTVLTMNDYKGSDTVHTFPTLGELRAVLGEWFVEERVHFASHRMGGQCPIFVLRRMR